MSMNATERHNNNVTKLKEVYPPFRDKVTAILGDLEAAGWEAIIAQAWRSQADQLAAFNAGNSKVKFGYHNVKINGEKAAMAVDIVDTRWQWNIPQSHKFWRDLGASAKRHGSFWGGDWHWRDVAHVQHYDNEYLASVEKGFLPRV